MTEQANRGYKGVYAILAIVFVSLAAVALGCVYYYKQANDLKEELHSCYMRAFHDTADYLNNIDVDLKKTMLATDATQLSALSAGLYMQAEAAKNGLAQIPVENTAFNSISKFLSQVGDYSSYLSRKVIGNGEITDEEFENLDSLSVCAEAVSKEFSKIENALYSSSVSVESLKLQNSLVAYAEEEDFEENMILTESLPQEYPALIYDGPFSEHLQTAEPEMLKNKQKISRFTAEDVVKMFLGEKRAAKVSYESDGGGQIETYMFTGGDDSGSISIEVTKKGGMALWMLDSREVSDARLSVEQAVSAGEMFLSQHGYPSMKSSYYDVSGNVATVNYAYLQDGTVMYPDLVKVKVALDNGEIVGFESRGYIMCHREREIPQRVIGEEAAHQKVGKHLALDVVSTAYIPLESKREVFCYEIKGTLGKNNFLIYINAETGREEKILMLLESENGILTV